jgi:regulator of replication initiation timing
LDQIQVEQLMEETARHYEGKMNKMYETIQNLKKRCLDLQKENRGLRQTNAKLVKQKKERQHYKNGKRGTKFNG